MDLFGNIGLGQECKLIRFSSFVPENIIWTYRSCIQS